MPVYLIQAGENDPVKIGVARNPKKRLAGLQVAHHAILALRRVWHGGEVEEAALHRLFSDFRIRGEWFRFCDAMLGDVGLKKVSTEPLSPSDATLALTRRENGLPASMQLVAYLSAHGLSAACFGRMIGVSHRQTMHHYVRGTRFPPPHVLRRIAKATGNVVTVLDFVDQHAPAQASAA